MISWLPEGWRLFLWLFLLWGPLLFFQRRIHFEIQAVLMTVVRQAEIALLLFSFLLFPGVLLHEFSHALTAVLLGVRVVRVSLWPHKMSNGRLQMGFVEFEQAGILREALIGAAPLLFGGIFVAFAAGKNMGLLDVWAVWQSVGWDAGWMVLRNLPARPDFFIWFYLALTVSSTMSPSTSDRRAWLPVGLVLGGVAGLGILGGGGPWLFSVLEGPLVRGVQAAILVGAISLGLHLLLFPLIGGLRKILERFSRVQITNLSSG